MAQAAREQGAAEDWIRAHVLGHTEDQQAAKEQRRLAFLPLPSYQKWQNGSRIGGFKRVAVTSFNPDFTPETNWAIECLDKQPLCREPDGAIVAFLERIPSGITEFVQDQYIGTSQVWETSTAILLPGHDDPGGCRKAILEGRNVAENVIKMADRIEYLIRKSLVQAGFSDVLAREVSIEWRKEGFLPGTPHCRDFTVSRHHTQRPRYHVRLTFPRAISGPLCLGDGRFYGMGLFLIPVE